MTRELPPYWFDGVHVLVAGTTGSGERWGGKTATAHYWATLAVEAGPYDNAIAYAPKGGGFAWPNVTTALEAAQEVQDGGRYLMWTPQDRSDPAADHADAVSFARGLSGRTVMVHDDAVTYSASDSLAMATALAGNPTGGGGGVKSIVATQDPWDLPRRGVRSNLPVITWVGPVTDEAMSWFQQVKTGKIGERVKAAHADTPYTFTVINGDEIHTYDPVPSDFAV